MNHSNDWTKRSRRYAAAVILLLLAGGAAAQSAIRAGSPPPIVIRSDVQGSTVWAHDRAGAPAQNATTNIGSTSGAGSTSAGVNNTGANVRVNESTVAQPSAIVTMGMAQCPALSPPRWPDASAGPCQGANIPVTVHNQVVPSTDPTGFPGYEGAASFACSNGAWQLQPGYTCTASAAPTCPTATMSWSASRTCAASFASSIHGTALTRASTNGNTGSATFTCSSGAWVLTANGGCSAPALNVSVPGTVNSFCGSVFVTPSVSGGVPPYSFYWWKSAGYNFAFAPYGTSDAWNYGYATITEQNVTIRGSADGSYTLNFRVRDAAGGEVTRTISYYYIGCP